MDLMDPLGAIDAQLSVLHAARADVLAEVRETEHLAVAAMTDGEIPDEAADRLEGLRATCHDFTAAIDDLQTERCRILPRQRCGA